MKNRKAVIIVLALLLAAGLGGFQYYFHRQIPKQDPKFIKEAAPTVDPATGKRPGTPPI